ncbi:hypothetical protein WME73_02460 [Sorangium sp. So ce302]|uniref:hypothetical protein n=1 Tax=Sorangium sp. So ce302 TaxID=3133297 RepID=UPI003F613D97
MSGAPVDAPAETAAEIPTATEAGLIPVSSGNAGIVGMHIAGFVVAPFDQTWFHSVGDIESQLGVTVAF